VIGVKIKVSANKRKQSATNYTSAFHRKQPKRERRRAKSGGVSQATNERGENTWLHSGVIMALLTLFCL